MKIRYTYRLTILLFVFLFFISPNLFADEPITVFGRMGGMDTFITLYKKVEGEENFKALSLEVKSAGSICIVPHLKSFFESIKNGDVNVETILSKHNLNGLKQEEINKIKKPLEEVLEWYKSNYPYYPYRSKDNCIDSMAKIGNAYAVFWNSLLEIRRK